VLRFPLGAGLAFCLTVLTTITCLAGQVLPLHGINATVWYTWPRFNGWDEHGLFHPPIPPNRRMPVQADFDAIAKMGFTAIRLGVDPALFMGLEGLRKRNMEQRIKLSVDQAVNAGLVVVFDLHPNSRHKIYGQAALSNPANSSIVDEYSEVVADVANLLKTYPKGEVLLELMNEPRAKCLGKDLEFWLAFVDKLIEAATRVAPELPLVVSGSCASSIEGLISLDAGRWRRDDMLFTFHFYEPFPFTHQSAPFTPWAEKYLSGLRWPSDRQNSEAAMHLSREALERVAADKRARAEVDALNTYERYASSGANKETIRKRLALVADWADRSGIARDRIFMGEFGVYRGNPGEPGASCEDRAAWTEDVISVAGEFGFSWSYFHLDGPFGLLRGNRREVDTELLRSLGLSKSGSCVP
jgi:hypothetical protein